MSGPSQLDLSCAALPAALRLLSLDATVRAGAHRLGDWAVQPAYPSTAFANCLDCGAGLVIDAQPGLPALAIDGDALHAECARPNQRTMDRSIRKRIVRVERDGKLCAFCRRPLALGQDDFCSTECLHEARIRYSPAYARKCVFQRDHAVCRRCRRDCLRLAEDLVRVLYEDQDRYWKLFNDLVERGFPPHRLEKFSLWDADHIRGVRRGGGGCGLDNYETLCIPCHQRKSAKQARSARHRDEAARQETEEWLRRHFPDGP